MKNRVIIWLGSSIWDKREILDWACWKLKKLGSDFRISSYIESEPWWGVAQNTFLNAVCVFYTDIQPLELLQKLQKIENDFWRKRDKRWDDRTLDLDILYYGDEIIELPELIVPHPRIKERDFVMNPILELFPDFKF